MAQLVSKYYQCDLWQGPNKKKIAFPKRNQYPFPIILLAWCGINEASPASGGHSTNCLIWLGHREDGCQVGMCTHEHMQGFHGNSTCSACKALGGHIQPCCDVLYLSGGQPSRK